MKRRTLILAGAAALMLALALPATAQWGRPDQSGGWQAGNHDRDRDSDRRAYQDGWRDGQQDRGKRFHPRGRQWKGDDYRAYEAGYRAGFSGESDRDRSSGRWGDRDHDRSSDQWGRDRGRGGSPAYRNGYSDGLQYGRHDRQAGKSSKPTDSHAYDEATNGYNSQFGNKDDYKREYRQGYQDGYQRGYGSR